MGNSFFAYQFVKVRRGGPQVLLKNGFAKRTLLLVWPWSPYLTATPPYDASAIRLYRGSTIVHVGDLRNPGLTTSAEAIALLKQYFFQVKAVCIPQWPHCHDTLSIWQRRP